MVVLVVCISNGDCCAECATGIEMRIASEAPGATGKYVRRKVPGKRNTTLSLVGLVNSSDPDETDSAGYNPYDHTPARLHAAPGAARVVQMRVFTPEPG